MIVLVDDENRENEGDLVMAAEKVTPEAINFMRKPAAATDLVAEARILKLGRVLAVGDVLIRSAGDPAPVARASLTYSIPPRR